MLSWRASLLVGIVIGLACVNPTDGCGCPPTPLSAAVFGRVQTTAGAPVAKATVFAYIAQAGDCSRRDAPDGLNETRADGTYTLGIAGAEETESTCVLVRVRAPLGSDLLDAPDTTVTLAIRLRPPFDSVRIDATLEAP
jgi:hypothetical protein